MNPEIEKYLNGEMDPEEQAAFEKRLAVNRELLETIKREKAFLDRIKTQMLREKIASALDRNTDIKTGDKPDKRNWYWILLLLFSIVGAGYWFWTSQNDPVMEGTSPPYLPELIVPDTLSESHYQDTTPLEGEVIAEHHSEPEDVPGSSPRSYVRGQESDATDKNEIPAEVWIVRIPEIQLRLDDPMAQVIELIKEGHLPDAYARLQILEYSLPTNDTLDFLKGYCLLEMKETGEALRYFKELPADLGWKKEIQWFKTLALMHQGNKKEAMVLAFRIAKDNDHPYATEASNFLNQIKGK